MKQCPLCSRPWVEGAAKCQNISCAGYKNPARVQEHVDFLVGKLGMKLDGWEASKVKKPDKR